MIELTTERMGLRKLTEADGEFMLALLNDPGFLQFVGDRGVRTLGEAVDYLRNGILSSYAEFGYGMYLCQRRSDGAAMGICGLVKRDYLADFDLGYGLLESYGGQGYAKEAGLAILEQARELRLPRLLAIVQSDNLVSIGLLKRLGFSYQRTQPATADDCELLVYGIDFSADGRSA